MPIHTLHHVQVAAPPGCEAQAREFYSQLLGLPELPKPAPLASRGGAWFSVGDRHQLHVGVEDDFSPARKAHPALGVPHHELTEMADRLVAAGTPVTWDDGVPGVRRFYVEDPWGNRLELIAADS